MGWSCRGIARISPTSLKCVAVRFWRSVRESAPGLTNIFWRVSISLGNSSKFVLMLLGIAFGTLLSLGKLVWSQPSLFGYGWSFKSHASHCWQQLSRRMRSPGLLAPTSRRWCAGRVRTHARTWPCSPVAAAATWPQWARHWPPTVSHCARRSLAPGRPATVPRDCVYRGSVDVATTPPFALPTVSSMHWSPIVVSQWWPDHRSDGTLPCSALSR